MRATDLQLPATARLARCPDLAQARQRASCQAAIALAVEQMGVAQACLDFILAYTAECKQFGKAIASFQAVKHAVGRCWWLWSRPTLQSMVQPQWLLLIRLLRKCCCTLPRPA